MTQPTQQRLQPTSWLAKRLNISVTTIERLRAQNLPDVPQHVIIGKSIRYDEQVVEKWLHERMWPPTIAVPAKETNHG